MVCTSGLSACAGVAAPGATSATVVTASAANAARSRKDSDFLMRSPRRTLEGRGGGLPGGGAEQAELHVATGRDGTVVVHVGGGDGAAGAGDRGAPELADALAARVRPGDGPTGERAVAGVDGDLRLEAAGPGAGDRVRRGAAAG